MNPTAMPPGIVTGTISPLAPAGTGGYPRIYIYDTTMHSARETAADGCWPQLYVKPTP